MDDEDDPLWKRILGNELLWTALAAVAILVLALYLATSKG
jgi:hypothetical protein